MSLAYKKIVTQSQSLIYSLKTDISHKKNLFQKQRFKKTSTAAEVSPVGIPNWLIKIRCLDNDTYK